MEKLLQSASNLVDWIETWSEGNGKYNGYVIHPIWKVVNLNNTPNCGQYYGIILGYLNLFKKTNKRLFLEKSKNAANFLITYMQEKNGRFKNDLFEYNPSTKVSSCVIYNALASIALLDLGNFLKKSIYVNAAEKNINWLLLDRFDGEKLSACVNQDMTVVEALLKLYNIRKNTKYLKIAKSVADFSAKYFLQSGKFKGGFTRGAVNENFIIPWYDSKSLLGFLELSKILGNNYYKNIVVECIKYIQKNIGKNGLNLGWKRVNDNWVKIDDYKLCSPVSYPLYVINRLYKTKNYIKVLLNFQLPTGAFKLTNGFGFNDSVGVLGWDHFSFLYLTEMIKENSELPEPTTQDFVSKDSFVKETREAVTIGSKRIVKKEEKIKPNVKKSFHTLTRYPHYFMNRVLKKSFKNQETLYSIRKSLRKISVKF